MNASIYVLYDMLSSITRFVFSCRNLKQRLTELDVKGSYRDGLYSKNTPDRTGKWEKTNVS